MENNINEDPRTSSDDIQTVYAKEEINSIEGSNQRNQLQNWAAKNLPIIALILSQTGKALVITASLITLYYKIDILGRSPFSFGKFIGLFWYVWYQDICILGAAFVIYNLSNKWLYPLKLMVGLLLTFYLGMLGMCQSSLRLLGTVFDTAMLNEVFANWKEYKKLSNSKKERNTLVTIYMIYGAVYLIVWVLLSIYPTLVSKLRKRPNDIETNSKENTIFEKFSGNLPIFGKITYRRYSVQFSVLLAVSLLYFAVYVPIVATVIQKGYPFNFLQENLLVTFFIGTSNIGKLDDSPLSRNGGSFDETGELYDDDSDPFTRNFLTVDRNVESFDLGINSTDTLKRVKVDDFSFLKRDNGKSPFKNVILFTIESGRADVWPFDYESDFAKKMLTDEARAQKGINPFFEQLLAESAHATNYASTVCYTAKSLLTAFCSMYPYPANELTEVKRNYYQRCLPAELNSHGFETIFMQPATSDWQDMRGSMRKFNLQTFAREELREVLETPQPEVNYFGYSEEVINSYVFDWIDKQVAEDKPFFFSYITNTNHHPWNVPNNFTTKQYTKPDAPNDTNKYLNTLRYTDEYLKSFFDQLESRNLLESTLVIINGDHGYSMGDRGPITSTTVYNENFRVPLLFYTKHPEFAAKFKNMTIDGFRTNLDIAPTILDLLNPDFSEDVRFDYGFQGNSMMHPAIIKPIISFVNPGMGGLKYRHQNLEFTVSNVGEKLVFDIEADPHMLNPLDLDKYEGGKYKGWKEFAEQDLIKRLKAIIRKYDTADPLLNSKIKG